MITALDTAVPPPQEPHVDAVVVSHNGATLLGEALRSLRSSEGVVVRITVVDNASTDGTETVATDADHFVTMQTNQGYGAAANAGLRTVSAPWVMVCNQDVSFHPGTVASMVAAARAEEAATTAPVIAAPALVGPDGARAEYGHNLPTLAGTLAELALGEHRSVVRNRAPAGDGDTRCEWVAGACLLARRETWARLEGFDERYFMYVEDVDLFWRLRDLGGHCVVATTGPLFHAGGRSPVSPYLYAVALANWSLFWRDRAGVAGAAAVRAAGAAGALARAGQWAARVPRAGSRASGFAGMFAAAGPLSLARRRWLVAATKRAVSRCHVV